jgi:Family of unknown function (DUF5906)
MVGNADERETITLPKSDDSNQLRKKAELRIVSGHEFNNDDIISQLLESGTQQLIDMNEKHSFVHSVGGKPAVLSWVYSDVFKKDVIEFTKPKDIEVRYCNQNVEVVGKKVPVPLGKWWLHHKERREYQTVIFDPAAPITKPGDGAKYYNLWQGFSVEPKEGSWELTKRHIFEVLCNKDRRKYRYLKKWLAWCIQNPDKRAEVAVVLKGKKGAGKGFIFTYMIKVFGNHGMSISNRNQLVGKHLGHLVNTCFLFSDEAYYPGDVEVKGAINALITEERISVEPKFFDVRLITNRLHIGMATNEEWVVPASEDERRYFINKVEDKYAKGMMSDARRKQYFDPLWAEIEGDGLSAMLFELQNMKLHNWHPRDEVPETEEMKKQKSFDKDHKAVLDIFYTGELPFDPDSYNRKSYVCSATRLRGCIGRKANYSKVIKLLRGCGVTQKHLERGTARGWLFPPLQECRDRWDEKYGKHDWDTSKDEKEEWGLVRGIDSKDF